MLPAGIFPNHDTLVATLGTPRSSYRGSRLVSPLQGRIPEVATPSKAHTVEAEKGEKRLGCGFIVMSPRGGFKHFSKPRRADHRLLGALSFLHPSPASAQGGVALPQKLGSGSLIVCLTLGSC
ncbi:Uncharacterized protein HZ326_25136 [Fusarium oxysporum f. sp. albedinis]|nr:Uncharacterized protein HZ326_25136 [Fusarium oxysporum f. sp. albedinis]